MKRKQWYAMEGGAPGGWAYPDIAGMYVCQLLSLTKNVN